MKKNLLVFSALLCAVGMNAQEGTAPDTLSTDNSVYTTIDIAKQYTTDGYADDGTTQRYAYFSYTPDATGTLTIAPAEGAASFNLTCAKVDGEGTTISSTSPIKDSETGTWTKGVEAGYTYRFTFNNWATEETPYVTLAFAFAEGTPYEPICFIKADPANNGYYSPSVAYGNGYNGGQPVFEFSLNINPYAVRAIAEYGGKTVTWAYDGYSGPLNVSGKKITVKALADSINAAKNEGVLKAGDEIRLTLNGVEDKDFSVNSYPEELVYTWTLQGIACTGVTPEAGAVKSYNLPIRDFIFAFDGEIAAEGITVVLKNGLTDEETEVGKECWTYNGYNEEEEAYTLTVDATKLPLPKTFTLCLKNVKDTGGSAITYGDEEGCVKAAYSLPDDSFLWISATPDDGEDNESISQLDVIKLTFPDEVVVNPDWATLSDWALTYMDMSTYRYVTAATVTKVETDTEDLKSVWLTLDKAVTQVNTYGYELYIPAQVFYNKRYYNAGAADKGVSAGGSYNAGAYLTYYIYQQFSAITIAEVSPAESGMLPSIPASIAVTFTGKTNVKSVTLETQDGYNTATTALKDYTLSEDGTVLTINLPEIATASFNLVCVAEDESGAPLSYNDEYKEGKINLSYTLAFNPQYTTPAEGAKVEKLDSIALVYKESVMVGTEYTEGESIGGVRPDKQIVVFNEIGDTITTATFGNADWESWENMHIGYIVLEKPITTPGVYTVVVPDTTIFDQGFRDWQEDYGLSWGARANTELRYTFTVYTPDAIRPVALPTFTDEITVYNLNGTVVAKGNVTILDTLPVGIYIVNGRKVVVR